MPTQTAQKTLITNQVLQQQQKSTNFYKSDLILQDYLQRHLSKKAQVYLANKLHQIGKQAATIMDELSMDADHQSPKLIKRTPYGETLDEIKFHPAYWQLLDIAAQTEMFYLKWTPHLRQQFEHESHSMSFALSQLFAMGEMGQYCPIAMTDGVARLIDLYGDEDDKARLIPKLGAKKGADLFTGAMFLTEKSGGSDVGRNMVSATSIDGRTYHLNGEKWFCSNVNAEVIFVLARTNPHISGTKGLSIFLVEKYLPDGRRNPMEIVRIKDKLGVRSMASGECLLKNTVGKLYGEEGQGMKIMLDMIHLMRVYNSIASVAGERRALVEAYQHLTYRTTFGKNALEHALVRDKFYELCSLYSADFYLTWRSSQALERADIGDEREQEIARLITPMAKYWTGKNVVYIVRECMELMGGMGYIEDLVMPKLFRDILVLPIWEGAGNIMILDMLRAAYKSPKSVEYLLEDIGKTASQCADSNLSMWLLDEIQQLGKLMAQFFTLSQTECECTAKSVFHRLIPIYQLTLLLNNRTEQNKGWMQPTIDYLVAELKGERQRIGVKSVPSKSEINAMMGWRL